MGQEQSHNYLHTAPQLLANQNQEGWDLSNTNDINHMSTQCVIPNSFT